MSSPVLGPVLPLDDASGIFFRPWELFTLLGAQGALTMSGTLGSVSALEYYRITANPEWLVDGHGRCCLHLEVTHEGRNIECA